MRLGIVECPYGEINYNGMGQAEACWKINMHDKKTFNADVCKMAYPADIDYYKECGVYNSSRCRLDVRQVKYEPVRGLENYEAMYKAIYDSCCDSLKENDALFFTGGFCTYAPAVAGALKSRAPNKKIGIIWLDAHSDMYTPENAYDDLVAGFPLSMILGMCMKNVRDLVGLSKPYDDRKVLLADYRFDDAVSDENMANTNILILKHNDFGNDEKWEHALKRFSNEVDVIYFHLDIDILDTEFIPQYILESEDEENLPIGWEPQFIRKRIKSIMDTNKVSVFSLLSAYFDWPDVNKEKALISAMRMISIGLSEWKVFPDFE